MFTTSLGLFGRSLVFSLQFFGCTQIHRINSNGSISSCCCVHHICRSLLLCGIENTCQPVQRFQRLFFHAIFQLFLYLGKILFVELLHNLSLLFISKPKEAADAMLETENVRGMQDISRSKVAVYVHHQLFGGTLLVPFSCTWIELTWPWSSLL